MRILLSFENLTGFGGTETYTVTVAGELERLGHDVAIYSPNRGAMAEFAREQGVPVLSSEQLPRSCDLVIASDAATCHELAGRYLDAVVVFVVHSADYMLQAPPQLRDRCHAAVVLNERVRRTVGARAWHPAVVRLRQPIDLQRFSNLGPCRPRARSALVMTNYLAGPRAETIEEACRANGLRLTWIGAKTRPTATPEVDIAEADLVIGLGRCVLEAMAAGRAAYVYGALGGDGWVTPERYPSMEADGFAGMSATELVIDADRMADDLANWDLKMGELNRDVACAHHSAREHAIALVDLADNLNASPRAEVSLSDELAHLIRLQWRSQTRAVASEVEAARLRSALAELQQQAAALTAQLIKADGDLADFRRTRRYRLATRVAAPLDWLRDLGSVKDVDEPQLPDVR
jgi:hypothetical protein